MKFISKRREYRLVIRGTEVSKDGYGRPMIVPGETVEFKQGMFFTEDKGLISYLLHHPLYGLKFTSEIGNDPVAIQKYSMVFDDGAELTGPQITAGFPERNLPFEHPEVAMVMGARSTVDKPAPQVVEESVPQSPPTSSLPKFVTGEQVEAIMDKKLDAFMDRLGSLVEKPKIKGTRSYHCPECGEEFKSGFDVGTHKKEKHSN